VYKQIASCKIGIKTVILQIKFMSVGTESSGEHMEQLTACCNDVLWDQ